jgi:predicted transcriptional regulator
MIDINMGQLKMVMTLKKLPEPYNVFESATVYLNTHRKRRVIILKGKNTAKIWKETGLAYRTTYARFLYQIDYWSKYKKLIPNGMEVDHIDDNSLNDTLSNYQLLTTFENAQKRDFNNRKYTEVSKELLSKIKHLLDKKISYVKISQKCDISPGKLKYILNTHFGYSFPEKFKGFDDEKIKKMLKEGKSHNEIGFELGISYSSVRRHIKDKLPPEYHDMVGGRNRKEVLKEIESLLKSGETSNSVIGKKVGYTDSNVCIIIQKEFPEYYKQIKEKEQDDRSSIITALKSKLDEYGIMANLTQVSKDLNLTQQVVHSLVEKYIPEYSFYELQKRRMKYVVELFHKDATQRISYYVKKSKLGIATFLKALSEDCGYINPTGVRFIEVRDCWLRSKFKGALLSQKVLG